MKKTYFKKAKKLSKKVSIEHVVDENKNKVLSFSLTQKETKRYNEWIEHLWSGKKIDDTEDSYALYPEFKFLPFELGICIRVSVGDSTLLVRSAWEDDEVNADQCNHNGIIKQ